ncbi:uncharacterized protein LOC131942437 [Physella acuta]|uniref:uncharacterized protein LOC131942437 n=1 Tax=Physella acuta TaxID=109671 RepID=UPI0027DE5721|nr:uncharacterized protein LOC131942437 [Physella acuta]
MSTFDEKVELFFKEADLDKSGELTVLELAKVLHKAGAAPTPEDVVNMFQEMDANNDQKMTLDELKKALAKRDPKAVQEAELRSAFKDFDTDNSGTVSVKEIEAVLAKQKIKANAEAIFKKADVNSDGKIDIEEFLKAFREQS